MKTSLKDSCATFTGGCACIEEGKFHIEYDGNVSEARNDEVVYT